MVKAGKKRTVKSRPIPILDFQGLQLHPFPPLQVGILSLCLLRSFHRDSSRCSNMSMRTSRKTRKIENLLLQIYSASGTVRADLRWARHYEMTCRAIGSTRWRKRVKESVFFPLRRIEKLHIRYHFHVWDERLSEVRLMTSFDTKKEEIDAFVRDATQ